MDTLDYTGISLQPLGLMILLKKPLESQDQLLYLTLPTLSIILTLSSTISQPLQNCQTLQWFLSPLYNVDLTRCLVIPVPSVQCLPPIHQTLPYTPP